MIKSKGYSKKNLSVVSSIPLEVSIVAPMVGVMTEIAQGSF